MSEAQICSLFLMRIDGQDTELREALAAEELPTDDLGQDGRFFFRIMVSHETAGFGGYELYGNDVLLRSIVIKPGQRGKGFGQAATTLLLQEAESQGARQSYLLTTSAAAFFEALGFTPVDRANAPTTILQTRQAASLCPASATLLTKHLSR